MKKNIFLFIILLFFLVIPEVFAIVAQSDNYTVGMFGLGLQSSNFTGNYTGVVLLTTTTGTGGASTDNYTGNIGFFDNISYSTTVTIDSYSISPASTTIGSTISLSISATDAEAVWANITYPNSTVETLALTNRGATNYATPYLTGIYNVTFYANSSTGAIASAADSFQLTEVTTPPSGGGGSGGGSTTITNCTVKDWNCSAWSICSNGKQIRECTKITNCNGTEGKPVEELSCSQSLNLSVSFGEINITQNRTLFFYFNVNESKGVENVGISIKFSLINNKNEGIFSRTENIIVPGGLTEGREIDELSLSDGKYTLRIDILYGDGQRSFVEKVFEISKGKIELEETRFELIINKNLTTLLIILGVLIISVLSTLIIILRKRNKRAKGELREGVKLAKEGRISEAKEVYEDIERDYKPEEDIGKHTYRQIIKFYNRLLTSNKINIFIWIFGLAIMSLFLTESSLGGIIGVNGNSTLENTLIIVIIFFILLIITLRKNISNLISQIFSDGNYSPKTIKKLIKKEVYSENGEYIGKIKEVILKKNKIGAIKITLGKKRIKKKKGVIIKYKDVKSVRQVMIVKGFDLDKIK